MATVWHMYNQVVGSSNQWTPGSCKNVYLAGGSLLAYHFTSISFVPIWSDSTRSFCFPVIFPRLMPKNQELSEKMAFWSWKTQRTRLGNYMLGKNTILRSWWHEPHHFDLPYVGNGGVDKGYASICNAKLVAQQSGFWRGLRHGPVIKLQAEKQSVGKITDNTTSSRWKQRHCKFRCN